MAKKKRKDESLYEILGLDSSASPNEIRSAYRKLSLQYHPDKNPTGAETFKDINRAHEILSDEEKRDLYDRYGLDGVQLSENSTQFGAATTEDPKTRWKKTFGLFLFFIFMDCVTGYPLEWLGAFFYTWVIIAQLSAFKIRVSLIVVFVDIVLWFAIPEAYVPYIANLFLYTTLMLWSNLPKQVWDSTAIIWLLIVLNDILHNRYYHSWTFLGIHAISFSLAYSALILIMFQLQMVPEDHPSYIMRYAKKALGYLLTKGYQWSSGENKKYSIVFPLLMTLGWMAICFFDYVTTISLEWMLLTAFVLFDVPSMGFERAGVLAICVVLVFFFLPVWITAAFANLVCILFVFFLGTALTLETDTEGTEKKTLLKFSEIPRFNFVSTGFLLLFDFFWRNRPQRWSIFASIVVVWGFYAAVMILLTWLRDYLEYQDKKKREELLRQQREAYHVANNKNKKSNTKPNTSSAYNMNSTHINNNKTSKPTATTTPTAKNTTKASNTTTNNNNINNNNANTATSNTSKRTNQNQFSSHVDNNSGKEVPEVKQQEHHHQTSTPLSSSSDNNNNISKKCEYCGETEAKLKKCSGCESVYYCSVNCQKLDRPQHKRACKAIASAKDSH